MEKLTKTTYKFITIFIIIIILSTIFVILKSTELESNSLEKISTFLTPAQKIQFDPSIEYDATLEISSFFQVYGIEGKHFIKTDENVMIWNSMDIFPKASLKKFYEEVGVKNEPQNTVVIYSLFTASAYSPNGFYDYFTIQCDQSCLTVLIQESFTFPASGNGVQVLKLLGYDIITDLDFAKNPKIINDYEKIILLHNEYVTQEMFDAITNHPKVLYLYPNVLHAEVRLNENESITLIQGHGYNDLYNGFNWEFDNTPMEYDLKCENWTFYEINNGLMLDCYPEEIILNDKKLLEFIKNF